jgi:antirestriction protein ArdC
MQETTPRGRPGRDLYAEVTDRIVEALERGSAPWVRPWRTIGALGGLRNAVSGHAYSGVNVMLLGLTLDARGFEDPRWLTYQQARTLGGQVRHGEHGTLVVFWKPFLIQDETGGEDRAAARGRTIPFLRHYTVFNVSQCDDLKLAAIEVTPLAEPERDLACDDFVSGTGARIRHGGSIARYRLRPHDDIELPKRSAFVDGGAYYATLLHELIHWTGDESRTPRPFGRRFGSPDYAREELVAEMGSAFLCQRFQVDGTLQHPEYLRSWLEALREDKRALFQASSKARQACAFLLNETETATS